MGLRIAAIGRRLVMAQTRVALLGLFSFTMAQAYAADHFVPSSVSSVDCGDYDGGVRAGDSIVLASGERGPLVVRNCRGEAGNPIRIRNDVTGRGPTVIRRSSAGSGGFIFQCTDCVHVVIDGTGKWAGAPDGAYCGAPSGRDGCGIKVTSVVANDSPTSYLRLNGMTTKISVRGVEIDGRAWDLNTADGVGIHQNEKDVRAVDYPGFWREDIVYEYNYVHDTRSEGMYIGPNWRGDERGAPLRNITIRFNLVEDTGRNGMTMKSATGGTNRIHHNVVRRTGLNGEGTSHGSGITAFEGGHNAKIYNNWVEAAGTQGIQHYNMYIPSTEGPFASEIFNNVIYDSGVVGGAVGNGYGITVARGDGTAPISTAVYNNTIVKTTDNGINFGSRITDSVARDNIVVATRESALSLGDNKSINNRTGAIEDMAFAGLEALNFALSSDSPARDAGSPEGFPAGDFQGVPRPQGPASDQGAFEFVAEGAVPEAPAEVTVD